MRVFVYVLNMRGQPLMPTSPTKARKLLKEGKAKIVQYKPFTIQLKYATGEAKQEVKLGSCHDRLIGSTTQAKQM